MRTCQCGNALVEPARGRKPVRCPECRVRVAKEYSKEYRLEHPPNYKSSYSQIRKRKDNFDHFGNMEASIYFG